MKAEERGLSLFCFLEELDNTESLQWSVAGTSNKHLEHNMLGSGKCYLFLGWKSILRLLLGICLWFWILWDEGWCCDILMCSVYP